MEDRQDKIDMLKDNVHRLCVTKDIRELDLMLIYAIERISKLHRIRKNEIESKEIRRGFNGK